MKPLLMLCYILFSSVYTYANEAWECTSTRKNVTIISTSWYGSVSNNQKIQDAFLKKLVGKLDLDELPTKIIILVDQLDFYRPNEFSSIAYDTVRPIDLSYLHHIQKEGDKYLVKDVPSEKPDSQFSDTLDINATYEKGINEIGLKVIFSHSSLNTVYNYDRIFALVKYGIENVNDIKSKQGKVLLTSYGNSKVSITTIDTALIKSIPTEQLNFDPAKALKRKNIAFPISIFAALIGAFVAIFAGASAKKKNAKT